MLSKNIRQVSGRINIHCNAVIASRNWAGNLERFGTVWYHKKGITNILSLAKVKENYHVTHDSQDGKSFLVVNINGQAQSFRMSNLWAILLRFDSREWR